jgi:hypothetical protein
MVGIRQRQCRAVVDGRQPAAEQHLALQLQLLGRLIGAIDMALGRQPFEHLCIAVEPGRLAFLGIGHHPEPGEIVADRPGEGLGRARGVGIVEPQQEAAAELFRQQPVEEGGAHIADMKAAGRRRGETGDDHGRRIGRNRGGKKRA